MDSENILPNSMMADLESALKLLHSQHHPVISLANCPKRASVTVIIRIRPVFPDKAESHAWNNMEGAPFLEKLYSFLRQNWVQRGDPEILLIKRASRKGDRWTGHIALPGGKRDAVDDSDRATSIRETHEEVGLDLTTDFSLYVGRLPERVVTTWGSVPLMILCPFVFILTRFDIPPLRLQPTEVNSVHWVPVRALLSPSLKTYERCDISRGVICRPYWISRTFFRLLFGQALFAATELVPSESVFCSSVPDFIPPNSSTIPILRSPFPETPSRPFLLWGLTQGIISDVLGLLPQGKPLNLWSWPTMSHIDFRFMIWLFTYRFRRMKSRYLTSGLNMAPVSDLQGGVQLPIEIDMDGLGLGASKASLKESSNSFVIEHMLVGYFDLFRRAVITTFLLRLVLSSTIAIIFTRRTRPQTMPSALIKRLYGLLKVFVLQTASHNKQGV